MGITPETRLNVSFTMPHRCYTIIRPTALGYWLLFGITTERHSASARNRVVAANPQWAHITP
jgi:hypothetical protein